jgi:protease-4
MAGLVPVARRAGANLARAARRLAAGAALPRRTGLWPVLHIHPDLGELAGPRLPWSSGDGLSLIDVLRTLDCAADDPQVDGVLLRLHGAPSGWSRLHSLRRGLEGVRQGGKPVVAYADSLDAAGLLLASAADRLWIPESGRVSLVGLRLESFHLRGLLDQLGLRAEVLRVGAYKSAAEHFTRDAMSPEEREQLEALADDWYGALVDAIASGRGLETSAVRDRIDRGPYTAQAAVEAGLIDACLYPDQVEQELEKLAPPPPPERPGPRRIHRVDGSVYHALRASDPGWRPLLRGLPRLAYVVARGFIHRGHGGRGIASDSVREMLEMLRQQEAVRGVVLRLDTPGGEPLASDLLWRDITRLCREKPVVVSMGDVVASGGYYMAVGADAILAEAGTVTGSIGVVGGKLNVSGLYQKLGIGREGVERGARAGIHSETRGFTPDERKVLRDDFASAYAQFVQRVAGGRALSPEAVERVAGGRVWSGARALRLGLVDALGGPLEALREVRQRAGLDPEERVLLEVRPRMRLLDSPLSFLRGRF